MHRFMSTKYVAFMSNYNKTTSINGIYNSLTQPNSGFTGHVTIIKAGFKNNLHYDEMRQINFWTIR